MSDRKRTPDLLDELLGGVGKQRGAKAEAADPAPEAAPTRRGPPPPARRATASRTPDGDSEESTADKAKATFYLSPLAMEALDDLWYQLRRMALPERRTSISKSLIVDLVIRGALEELERDGRSSALAQQLEL